MLRNEILTKATELHEAGNLDEAESLYRQLLDMSPNDSDALHFLGVIAHQKDSPATAVDYMYKAIIVNGINASYHADLGSALFDWGKTSEAISSFNKAIELEPNQPKTLFMMGQAYRAIEKPSLAVSAFEKAIELSPSFFEAHYCMANALKEDERPEEAINTFKKTLDLIGNKSEEVKNSNNNNNNIDHADMSTESLIFNEIGECLNVSNKHEEALEFFKKSYELNSNYATPLYNKGNTLVKLKKYDEAIEAYKQSLEIDENFADAHCNIGNVHAINGDYKAALEEYKAALDISPQNAPTLNSLALFVRETITDVEEALGLLLSALTYSPEIEKLHENFVDTIKVLREKGEIDKAEKIAKNWLKHFPSNPIDEETIKEITNDFMPDWIIKN
ncbi:MAG: tetratricopeptide repeat protein [Alphaproteobacteria bacterium]|nr:tetratricopeptide repeat protein [Alphaproteobacteria bacterium]